MKKLRAGFTLIELMIVIVILGLLAALVAPKFLKSGEEAKVTTTQVQMKNVEQALKLYKLHNSVYPTTEQGLKALVEKPETEPVPKNWKGPYMDEVPKDAWGNEFIYISDGKHFTLISPGPDGEEGTEDDIKVSK
ncbi:type II secretion system major pseudopilin GspG [Phorcysia thermohydrogeniphila]|uniref:Type II secretion system core protein G n=1 Tax=Phorcysia thermohydrogeniphila TaxID=936138 RepID=A0A4R1GER9_9BACT|nr:type II secretion system major pseudopilin GspG [Phorcysia thermohydrogeniphila]TCK05320.1 type II secretion system protein G (GspG) [Phorcysia thermohydrogeniphila]TCK05330.1 general secretion pathway protein G [Phorcysia thermohydrogeniphila]